MSGNITRQHNDLFIISEEILQKTDISACAKGVYFLLCSLPEDMRVTIEDLYGVFTEHPMVLERAVQELVTNGYAKDRLTDE